MFSAGCSLTLRQGSGVPRVALPSAYKIGKPAPGAAAKAGSAQTV